MREIKFRAWNKKYGSWEGTNDQEVTIWWNDSDGTFEFDHSGDIILMQYTGLKDKNNVEIFENDIVICDDGYIYEVVYFDCDAQFKFVTIDDDDYFTFDDIQIENVIGNIYENPELLK